MAIPRSPNPCRPLETPYRAVLPMALALMALSWLAGCESTPSAEELRKTPPRVQDVVDGRAAFRDTFCRHYAAQGASSTGPECDYWLWRLPGEFQASTVRSPDESASGLPTSRYRTLIIPGAFGECFGTAADPFGEALPALRSKGHLVEIVPVEGRSGTERNAQLIAAWIDAHSPSGEPLILLGYSKGIADILQYLADFPASAQRVKAIVSIAGVVAGTSVADSNTALFDLVVAHLPNPHCARGDAQVVDSLRRDVRTAWLAQHPLPAQIRFFSLAAFTTRDRVARALMPAWRPLTKEDIHTDGQVLTRDSVIPGSTLLGYVNADHWELALGLEQSFKFLAARPAKTSFPRAVLLESVLDFTEAASTEPPPR